jgi:hypothetical protein
MRVSIRFNRSSFADVIMHLDYSGQNLTGENFSKADITPLVS